LLKENVNEKGLINYKAFLQNIQFDEYIAQIETAELNNYQDPEKLAFFINAYNALTIKNVINHYPISSPMEVDGFFKKKTFQVAGMELSLDDIEYKYILPINKILPHFGLVCAAISCPKLIRKAYSGKNVLNQLEVNAKLFLNDETKNHLDREAKTLYLSSIFKWFRESFEEEYGSLLEAVTQFMNEGDVEFLNENEVEIKFLKYDWKLNGQ
jgi:hypothetical protein